MLRVIAEELVDGTLVWNAKNSRNPENQLRISYSADGRFTGSAFIETFRSKLVPSGCNWLTLHDDFAVLDSKAFQRWIVDSLHANHLKDLLWLDGKHHSRCVIDYTNFGIKGADAPRTHLQITFTMYTKINRANTKKKLNAKIASKVIPVRVDRKEDLLLDTSTRIFLSHKGADKDRVRRFKTTLKLLGFQPWLDEEDMPAGTEIHRGIQQGMKNSCAAVFFITPNFIDDQHLRNEINYAIAQKTEKRERFAIITLVISGKGSKPSVPELLTNYVYKHPRTDLEALNEIIRALPITLGVPTWKPV